MNSLIFSTGTCLLSIGAFSLGSIPHQSQAKSPNIIVVLCDDMGYGDIGPFGHPTIRTPNLDRMAEQGQKWTSFYSAASLCTPSRAGLLTGRLPIRSGMCGDNKRGVLFPDSPGGLPSNEITIAKALKDKGYHTACIGKWHLGHLPQYSPKKHGFDYHFGIPYSNDMDRIDGIDHYEACSNPKIDYFQLDLIRNGNVVEHPVDQTTITKRYTEETIQFISENKKNPFFVYLAHTMPHVPLFRSKAFENKSLRGIYGDVVEELDWSMGKIMDYLKETGLDKNTLVIFTSDNGPWLIPFNEQGGSAGLLRGGKGGAFEGGMRVPTLFWWPGKVEHHVVMDMASSLDLFPTFCHLAGIEQSNDRIVDGYDLSPLLFGNGKSKREHMFYYRHQKIFAVRIGAYKVHFSVTDENGNEKDLVQSGSPLVYNLEIDPSEKYNIADTNEEIIEIAKKLADKHLASVVPVENQLEKIIEGGKTQGKSLQVK